MTRLLLALSLVTGAAEALDIAASRAGASVPAPTCSELASALREPTNAPTTVWGQRIADAVFGAHQRLESRPAPSLHFITRHESGAWYCASDDTIYVSTTLLRFAWLGKDGDGGELLAWALAHELAHRRFDPRHPRRPRSALASPTPNTPCPTEDPALEAAADRRATFLMALARHPDKGRNFSPFELARRDTLAAFFETELGWPADCAALEQRIAATKQALSRMHEYATLYDTATLLSFASDLTHDASPSPRDTPRGPPELLAELHRRLAPDTSPPTWEALPELSLLRAFAHLERAGRAGWCPPEMARHDLVPDPCTLACPAVFPRHPGHSPIDRTGRRAARLSTRESDLAAARTLIERARQEGLSASQLAGAETCLAYQLGDPEAADRALLRLQPETARVRAERRNLQTLVALQRHLLAEPAAIGSPVWLAALDEARSTQGALLDNDTPTSDLITRWLEPPRVASPPSRAFAAFSPRPDCGPGPALEHDGLVTRGAGCVTVAGLDLDRLAPDSVPPRRDLWAEACELVELGVADDGQAVVRATCPSLLGDTFVLFFDGFMTRNATRIRLSASRP